MNSLYFVILHYLVKDETINCVESILSSQDGSNFRIIIVDNGSPNNSGVEIKMHYKLESRVKVILNSENLGFAKGNNIGFQYAKKEGADFIYMINNDTYIQQGNCLAILQKAFEEYSFHILGPDIVLTKNNDHQNPAIPTLQDRTTLDKMLFQHKVLYWLSFLTLDLSLPKFKKKLLGQQSSSLKNKNLDHKNIQEGVKLHGSAMVFSKRFIDLYDGLYPKTFMYSEEAILYYIVKRDGLKTLYYPKLQIFHSEDAATEELLGKSSRKRRFYYKHYVQSGNAFLELMKKDGVNV